MTSVNVLIPVYKAEKTLERSINSVLSQTVYNNIDLFITIVINGPLDGSVEISQNLAKKYGKINILYSQPGIVPALNHGLKTSKQSDFIARIDADDIWYPQKLEKQLNVFKENLQLDILGTQIRLVNLGSWEPTGVPIQYPLDHDEMVNFLKAGHNPIAHPSVLFRSRILKKVGGYDDLFPLAEDMWLWSKAVLCGYKIGNTPDVLVDYTSTHNPNYKPIVGQLVSCVHRLVGQIS